MTLGQSAKLMDIQEESTRRFENRLNSKVNALCYGDKINIYFRNKEPFFLACDGISTNRVLFSKLEPSSFMVVPPNRNRIQNKLRKTTRKMKEKINKLTDENISKMEEEYRQEVPQEIMDNWRYYEKEFGKPIKYNSTVQLIHEKTQEYVRISKDIDLSTCQYATVGNKKGEDFLRVYSLKLSIHCGQETEFIFAPCFKYQETDTILTSDGFYLGFKDEELLNKCFHVHFNPSPTIPDSQKFFNFYFSEEKRTPLRFNILDETYLKKHIFSNLNRKALWITHIEKHLYLSLKKIEKLTDQDENELGEFIEPAEEALSQAFSLSFKPYDPNKTIPSDGLWVGEADSDPNFNKRVTFQHIMYSVKLTPLELEQLVRTTNEEGNISAGSIVKLSSIVGVQRRYIGIEERGSQEKSPGFSTTHRHLSPQYVSSELADYSRSVKTVVAREQNQPILKILSDLARFIRTFDLETIKRYSDFTEEALIRILSKALKKIKQMCINRLPNTMNAMIPYKYPIESLQKLIKDMGCIDSVSSLLLKLFPGGASVNPTEMGRKNGHYAESEIMEKLLGQLLTLITISVKNNKENKMYTFQRTMRIIQKYIGLHLKKNEEDKALLSVVENCEEILLDSSLEHIINQFVRELANQSFESKIKKHEILNILRIFCVNEDKGINSTQDILYNALFETEIGSKVLLLFKFSSMENMDLILKLNNGLEIDCCKPWNDIAEKIHILIYFKNQLYLFSDMVHQNEKILTAVKELFPIQALLSNLCNSELDAIARTGLTRIFTSLFMNTEKKMFGKNPKMQRVLGELEVGAGWKVPTFVTPEQLDTLLGKIKKYFDENSTDVDSWLSYEYLRLINYLINNDFILGEINGKTEWEKKLKRTYELFSTIFLFCVNCLRISKHEEALQRRRTTTGSLSQIADDFEEAPTAQLTRELITPEQLEPAPEYLKFPLQFFYIFQGKMLGEKNDDLYQSYNKDIKILLEKEICNFMTQFISFVHDGYLSTFTNLFSRCMNFENTHLVEEGKKYIEQLVSGNSAESNTHLMEEVMNAMKFQDIKQLFKKTQIISHTTMRNSFVNQIIEKFSIVKDEQLENGFLRVLIESQFKWNELGRFIENLFLLKKQDRLVTIMSQLQDLIDHTSNSLDISDIKSLKKVSACLKKFDNLLDNLIELFSQGAIDISIGNTTRRKSILNDVKSINMYLAKFFMKNKLYLTLLDLLKLCQNMKLEAANNILEEHHNLGLHAVTISRELLEILQMCSKLLILFCTNEPKGKTLLLKYISRVTLIPPPKDPFNEAKWKEYTELTNKDIELLCEICRNNNKIAFLNNQQIIYFKSIVALLNQSICKLNIDKIFEVFESIMDQTTHHGLYKEILGYFWDNRKYIDTQEIERYQEDTSEETVQRMSTLIRITLLLSTNPELRFSKSKLRDIISLDNMTKIIKIMYDLYKINLKLPYLTLFRLLTQVYGEIYLDNTTYEEEIKKKFFELFSLFGRILEEEPMIEQFEIKFFESLDALFKRYKRLYKSKDFRTLNSQFSELIKKILLNISKNLSEIDERKNQIYEIIEEEELSSERKILGHSCKSLLLAKAKPIIHKICKESNKFKTLQSGVLKNELFNEQLALESDRFSDLLLEYISEAGNHNPSGSEEKTKKEKSRLFILKIIEYIGRCGKSSTHIRTTKYLLLQIIRVINRAGKQQETEKSKRKAVKKILLTLDSLRLTRTILLLLCSDESEALDAILPVVLKLANRMLKTATKKIQDQFYKEFSTNHKSEKLFERMFTAINRNIFIHKWHPQMFAQKKRTKMFQTIEKLDIQKQILNFLKLLCMNYHQQLQTFLIYQPNFKTQYNMITLLVNYLNTLIEEMKALNAETGENIVNTENISRRKEVSYTHAILTLHALAESMQGPCSQIQDAVAGSELLNIINTVLLLQFNFSSDSSSPKLSDYQLCRVKDECVNLILELFEQREKDDEIIIKVRQTIKEKTLLDNLKYVYYVFEHQKGGNYTEELLFQKLDQEENKRQHLVLSLGFRIHFVNKKLNELSSGFSSEIPKYIGKKAVKVTEIKRSELGFFGTFAEFCVDLVMGVVRFFSSTVRHASIDSKKFEKIKDSWEFTKKAVTFFEYYTGTVDIVRNKKTEVVHFPLLPYSEAITEEQQQDVLSNMPLGQAKAKLDYFFGGCLETLQTMKNEYFFAKTFRFYPIFGAVAKHVFLWRSLSFYTAILINILLFSYKKHDKGFNDNLENPKFFDILSQYQTEQTIFVLGVFNCVFAAIELLSFLFKYIPKIYGNALQKFNDSMERAASILEVMQLRATMIMNIIIGFFTNGQLYSVLAYFILGVCGLCIHPFFFCYHLLTALFRYQKLIAVLQAIWQPITEIFLTLSLYIIIEYLFAVVGYYYFAKQFPSYTCHSLYSCIIIVIDQTFKNNAGIGNFLGKTYTSNTVDETVSFSIDRVIYDQLFKFIQLILILQILAGLIIDKFGEIRENSENMEEELRSVCIICGEKGDIIERKYGTTFEDHKADVHNLWNYLLFIGYIKEKAKRELTGIEGYVKSRFKNQDISWLPYSLWEGEDEEAKEEQQKEHLKIILDFVEAAEQITYSCG